MKKGDVYQWNPNIIGILVTIIVYLGGVMIFVWKFLARPLGGAWDIYELRPAFICALAAIFVVSLVTAEPEKAVLDEYDEVNKMIQG